MVSNHINQYSGQEILGGIFSRYQIIDTFYYSFHKKNSNDYIPNHSTTYPTILQALNNMLEEARQHNYILSIDYIEGIS
jgi:hypothetical protein